MESIYSRDNYNISYKRFSSKVKKRPGRPPLYATEPPTVSCFVCDQAEVSRQKVNLLQGISNNKEGFVSQISGLLGDEFLIIVQEDDYLCKQCVSLFNSMDKFEKQLATVKQKLLVCLTRKYNLNNATGDTTSTTTSNDIKVRDEREDTDDNVWKYDEIGEQLSKLYGDDNCSGSDRIRTMKCNVCAFSTTEADEFDKHMRDHISTAAKTEFTEAESNTDSVSDNRLAVGEAMNTTLAESIKLYKCSVCLKVYLSKSKCLQHMRLCHAQLGTRANCSIKDHLNTVSFCETCRLTFADDFQLIKHKCSRMEEESTPAVDGTKPNADWKRAHAIVAAGEKINSNNAVSSSCSNEETLVREQHTNCIDHLLQSSDNGGVGKLQEDTEGEDDEGHVEDDLYSDEEGVDDDDDDSDGDDELERYTCGKCGVWKGDLVALREHLSEARLQRDLLCSVCGQSFNAFCKLIKHSSGHEINSKPVDCIYCPSPSATKSLPDLLSLNYHMKKAHLQLLDERTCHLCQRLLPTLDYIEKHKVDGLCIDKTLPDEIMDLACPVEPDFIDTTTNTDVDNDDLNGKRECDKVSLEESDSAAIIEHEQHFSRQCLMKASSNNIKEFSADSEPDVMLSELAKSGCERVVNGDVPAVDAMMDTTTTSTTDDVGVEEEVTSVVYKCGVCGEQRNTRDELLLHFESHSGGAAADTNHTHARTQNSSTWCEICQVHLPDEAGLRRHQVKHTDNSVNVKCLYCHANVHDRLHLKHHIMENHLHCIRNLHCDLCAVKFNSHSYFRNHLLEVHPPQESHFCKKCAKSFNFRWKLLKHYSVYHKNKFKCRLYGNSGSETLSDLERHERSHLSDASVSNVKCNICGRLFRDRVWLKLHKTRHSCDLSLVCTMCELSFNRMAELDEHISHLHKGVDRLYRCNSCGKCFTLYRQFRIHRTNHEKENAPLACRLCAAKFTNWAHRAAHKRRLHHGKCSASFSCAFCNRLTTNNVSSYKTHTFSHIKKYRHHCKQCLKRYTKRVTLNQHKYRIHKLRRGKPCNDTSHRFPINESDLATATGDNRRDRIQSIAKNTDNVHRQSPFYRSIQKTETFVQ